MRRAGHARRGLRRLAPPAGRSRCGEGMRASDLVGGFNHHDQDLAPVPAIGDPLGLGAYLVLQAEMTGGEAMIAVLDPAGARRWRPSKLGGSGQMGAMIGEGRAGLGPGLLTLLRCRNRKGPPRMALPRAALPAGGSQLAVAAARRATCYVARASSFRIVSRAGVWASSGASGFGQVADAVRAHHLGLAARGRPDPPRWGTLDQYEPDALGRAIRLPAAVGDVLFDGTIRREYRPAGGGCPISENGGRLRPRRRGAPR